MGGVKKDLMTLKNRGPCPQNLVHLVHPFHIVEGRESSDFGGVGDGGNRNIIHVSGRTGQSEWVEPSGHEFVTQNNPLVGCLARAGRQWGLRLVIESSD